MEFVSNSYVAGGIVVMQCNIRDITERKKIDMLKDAKRLLEEERARIESIANTAHELRTPLAIIKGNIDISLRKKTKISSQHKNTLRVINHEVIRLSNVLSDLGLITSKAWDLKKTVSYEKINLRSLVKTIVSRCKIIAYKKNILITAKSIPNIIILGDRKYLEKMFVNLIENSIIYGVRNGHTVISAVKQDTYIKIDVSDDGTGISKEDLPHVFERFYRGDKAHHGVGVGLGLSIVKWIAELHSGEVSVENKKNKGSIFSVILPMQSRRAK